MSLELVVVTPEGEALSELVDQVVLPGEAGEFGVLESHERFLTPLAAGPMEVQSGGGSRWAAISSGFAEVDGARVVVLVDACSMASDLDRVAVEAELFEAEAALSVVPDGPDHEGERVRLGAVVARAELKLDIVGR